MQLLLAGLDSDGLITSESNVECNFRQDISKIKMVFGRRRQLKRNIVLQIRERACYGDKFRISNVPKAALTGTPDDGVEDEEESHLIHPQQKFISARHAQLVEILSVLISLSDHYQVSNYENADYELLYDAVDNLDRVILELQDEAGWLVAVRSLTSLTSTKSIVNHVYLPIVHGDVEQLPELFFGFAKRALGVFHFIACHNPSVAATFGDNRFFLKSLFTLLGKRTKNIYVEAALVLEDVGRATQKKKIRLKEVCDLPNLLRQINDKWQKRLAFVCQALFSYTFKLCENAKVKPSVGNNAADTRFESFIFFKRMIAF